MQEAIVFIVFGDDPYYYSQDHPEEVYDQAQVDVTETENIFLKRQHSTF